MKTRTIIASLVLMLMAQVANAQDNAEALIRILVNQMKSHKNVEKKSRNNVKTNLRKEYGNGY